MIVKGGRFVARDVLTKSPDTLSLSLGYVNELVRIG